MKSLKQYLLVFSAVFILSGNSELPAQCAMCKQSVESSIEGGSKVVGRGLNNGIMYLMSVPYLILGGIGFMVYKNWKGRK
jgi:hypothetical protein